MDEFRYIIYLTHKTHISKSTGNNLFHTIESEMKSNQLNWYLKVCLWTGGVMPEDDLESLYKSSTVCLDVG